MKKNLNMQNISFKSTRNNKNTVDFWQSIAQGMASDGGLLVPTSFPKLSPKQITDGNFWKNSKISDFSFLLHRVFIPKTEISDTDLKEIMRKAHNFDLPLEKFDDSTFILRIDQGPTASFKDVAARSLAGLLEKYCEKHETVINIVVATSGDTGVAIADAFGGSKRITVSILYPHGGVSEIQEKQMLFVAEQYKNVQALPVQGNFDTCQDIAKTLQQARELSGSNIQSFITETKNKLGTTLSTTDTKKLIEIISTLHLSSANSINIWRLIPQMTQYFVAYGKLVKEKRIKAGQSVVFSVPTGNVGHLMAGIYAKMIGLPVQRFIVATNTNNILANVIGSGAIKHHRFAKTSSPSMDILDPSNLERLLHFAQEQSKSSGNINFSEMKRDIKTVTEEIIIPLSKYGIGPKVLHYLQKLIWAEDIETDEEVYAMMERVSRVHKKTLEPHGVTGLIATMRGRGKHAIEKEDVVVVMETAHPDKFPTALKEAKITVPKKDAHPVLTRLAKLPLSKMKKPKPLSVDLLSIAKKIKSIAY